MGLAYWILLPPISSGFATNICWRDGFSPRNCCFPLPNGNPLCFDEVFTFEVCCGESLNRILEARLEAAQHERDFLDALDVDADVVDRDEDRSLAVQGVLTSAKLPLRLNWPHLRPE